MLNNQTKENEISRRTLKIAARSLICLMMALALVFPAAVPADVYAAYDDSEATAEVSDDSETADSEESADTETADADEESDDAAVSVETTGVVSGSDTESSKKSSAKVLGATSIDDEDEEVTTSYRQYISSITIGFKVPTISDVRLSQKPRGLKVTGQTNSMKLKWNSVSNPSGIDGYVIIRRDVDGDIWREIAKVSRNTTTYTDSSDISRNVFYFYTVVAFKKSGSTQKVSNAAAWGGAVTSWSSTKNAYEISYTNDANIVSIMKGSCAQALVKYPNNSYSTHTRWWSSNPRVAKVNKKGQITGVSVGRARIYAKTPSGINNGITVNITKPGTAQAMITTFKAWEGYSRINGKQNAIIDIYNSVTPWPAGYRMRYSDAWCDATVSAAAIKTGNATRIGRECGVPRHIDIFKKLGIWEEDGTIRPKPGDIIVFSWNRWSQPNNASASHIGIVEKVVGNTIYTIEGNRGIGVVGTREIPVGWGCIRGYARPKYAK